jgi:dUTP pyrophosphatase
MDNKHFDFLGDKAEELKKILEDFGDVESDDDFNAILKEFDMDLEKLDADMKNYTPKLPLGYTKLNSDAVTPVYNYPSDSGFDLHSTTDLEVPAFGRVLVPTGLSFDIKDGYEIQVRSKSGLAIKQGLMVLNSPGTVDNGYTGEVQVIVFNTNNHTVMIPKGMKVGQAVLSPVVNGKWVELEERNTVSKKDRNNNGFGSTGI